MMLNHLIGNKSKGECSAQTSFQLYSSEHFTVLLCGYSRCFKLEICGKSTTYFELTLTRVLDLSRPVKRPVKSCTLRVIVWVSLVSYSKRKSLMCTNTLNVRLIESGTWAEIKTNFLHCETKVFVYVCFYIWFHLNSCWLFPWTLISSLPPWLQVDTSKWHVALCLHLSCQVTSDTQTNTNTHSRWHSVMGYGMPVFYSCTYLPRKAPSFTLIPSENSPRGSQRVRQPTTRCV